MVDFVRFPAVHNATADGLLAMGGDLDLDTLVSAYSQGIFPWFNEGQPVLWWSPDPRLVLRPDEIKISRSLAKKIRQQRFRLSCNRVFDEVIAACALRGIQTPEVPVDTWITESMHQAYRALHAHGYAHSIEVWENAELVGGLYGVALGDVFFGESMFSRVSDASKIALAALCRWLSHKHFSIIDCQVTSEHLLSLGAVEIARDQFLESLKTATIDQPCLNFSHGFETFFTENAIKKI